jgi:protein-S-isoprenylcysteine O-methyltransferase Ste14
MSRPRVRLEGVASALCNVSLALLFALFAVVHYHAARRTGQWLTTVPLVMQEGLLVALFLSRRSTIAASSRPFDWFIGAAGTFLPLFLRTTPELGPLRPLGIPLQVIGLWLALMATVGLGRSFGLIAGNRGVKTGGVYRLVRHPMYAAYYFGHVGYVLVYPSGRNLFIAAATMVALYVRAIVEERFLEMDPEYRAYRERVPWRFIPLVH